MSSVLLASVIGGGSVGADALNAIQPKGSKAAPPALGLVRGGMSIKVNVQHTDRTMSDRKQSEAEPASLPEPCSLKSYDDATISGRQRILAVYGKEKKRARLKGRARMEYAKILAKREPWGMILRRYKNPTIADLGPYRARRSRAGGPWSVRVYGKLMSSESLEELFLQVVEETDSMRPDWRAGAVHYYRTVKESRNRRGTFLDLDGEEGSIIHTPGTRWGYLPSETFFGAKV